MAYKRRTKQASPAVLAEGGTGQKEIPGVPGVVLVLQRRKVVKSFSGDRHGVRPPFTKKSLSRLWFVWCSACVCGACGRRMEAVALGAPLAHTAGTVFTSSPARSGPQTNPFPNPRVEIHLKLMHSSQLSKKCFYISNCFISL